MILVNLTYSLGSCLHFLARILFNTIGHLKKKGGGGIYPRVTLNFFNLVGGRPKHFPVEVCPLRSLVWQCTHNINYTFSSAIFCSPIAAVHSAGWKSLPCSTCSALTCKCHAMSPFYQSAVTVSSPFKDALLTNAEVPWNHLDLKQDAISEFWVCAPWSSSHIWNLLSLNNSVFYYENNPVFMRWDYLTDSTDLIEKWLSKIANSSERKDRPLLWKHVK